MPHQPVRRLAAATATLLALAGSVALAPAASGTATTGSPAAAPAAAAVAAPAAWTPRPATYPATALRTNLLLPMSDGVQLRGDLILPAGADGVAAAGRFPVIVEITAYNKTVLRSGGAGIGGADPAYLVKRGYAKLIVDARGTGTSPGTWQVFGPREQKDAGEIVTWAARQGWSNGSVGMVGPSYMGISQLFAAGQQPEGLKAIFPQVPSADVYRDVVGAGGQLDVGFMPLWLGLVNLTGLIPSGEDGLIALQTILGHLTTGTGAPTLELAVAAVAGGAQAYDGPYYRERSTLTQAVPHINVPTFLIGGEYDLFQRGTPMVYQALKDRGVPVKMILGPWNHLQGSSGADVGKAGYGTLAELQLRWFDHYVRGVADRTLDTDIADFTYYELGSGTWVRRDGYLDSQRATTLRLSGSAIPALRPGKLTTGPAAEGTAPLLPIPVSGLCTRSASQWTAGVTSLLGLQDSVCETDNTLNDHTGVVYETGPLTQDLRLLGPIGVRLYASSVTGDGMLSVHVSRVGTDGKVDRLSGGWQVMSLAALDRSRSRVLDGEVIQPWHPYTKESQRVRAPGEVTPIDVEVFPTGAVIPAGQRLRISVNAFDVPHAAPHLGVITSAASVITLHTSERYPSKVVLPTLSGAGSAGSGTSGALDASGSGPLALRGDSSGDSLGASAGDAAGSAGTAGTSDPAYDATGAAADALARVDAARPESTDATRPMAALREGPAPVLALGAILLLVVALATSWVRLRR
jgi:putative CocE/NonD family hydrolase